MITLKTKGGRLGADIHLIYGLFKFAKNNNVDFDDVIFDINYTSDEYHEKSPAQQVYKINLPLFKNIENNFQEKDKKYWNDFIDFDLKIDNGVLDDITKYIDFYEFSTFTKESNISFRNFWPYDIKDIELLKYLIYSKDTIEYIKDKFCNLNFSEYTAFHIRRGDLVLLNDPEKIQEYENKYKHNNMFWGKSLLDVNYIHKTIESCNTKVLIFSDEIEWCKKNIINTNVAYMDPNNLPYEDMLCMSLCHNIIENQHSMFAKISVLLNKINKNEL